MLKEIMKFFNKNYEKLGYRERKIFNCPEELILLEESKDNPGLYKISTPCGSFEFAWNLKGYERGTILG